MGEPQTGFFDILEGMDFDQRTFADLVLQSGVIGFQEEPITFKSGRQCNCYVNWRVALNDAYLLDQVSDHVLAFARSKGLAPKTFYGVPEGATKLGVLVQHKWAKAQPDYAPGAYVAAMGRAKPKEHGDPRDRFFVGMPQGETVVLEDTTTTGGSLLTAVDNLQAAGVPVIAAIALTNRNELDDAGLTVPQALQKKNVPYYALSDLRELLPAAYEALKPSAEVRQAVETYFEKYGSKE